MEEERNLTWRGLVLSSGNACQQPGCWWSVEKFWLRLANSFDLRGLQVPSGKKKC
jgi:hypothetical protein